jgi:hypothetical protein
MTRFLRTTDGGLINTDRILRIEEGGRDRSQWRSRATLDDGTGAMLAGYDDERAWLKAVARWAVITREAEAKAELVEPTPSERMNR